MIGKRRDLTEWSWEEGAGPRPGDYGKLPDGEWYGIVPTGAMVGLRNHQVEEHADGTITVKPSILVYLSLDESWHGWLEKGIWRNA